MACGDAANAWVPSLGTLIWTGTVGTDGLTAVFVGVAAAAATVVGLIPGVGTWSKDSSGLHWTTALEGYTWHFTVHADACNASGDVTAAAGVAVDGNSVEHTVTMTRSV